MGAGQSSSGAGRTVTVENDIPVGVVNLSDEVVQRLKGQHVRNLQAARDAAAASPSVAAAAQSAGTGAAAMRAVGGGGAAAQVVYYGEPSATAVEVRRQKDAELRQNDAYWQKRMQQQELAHQKHGGLREKEFQAALEDVRSRFQNAPPQHQPPPCRELKARLVQCLRSHPGETLRCTGAVEQFTSCVAQHRTRLLDAKHSAPAAAAPAAPAAATHVPTAVAAH